MRRPRWRKRWRMIRWPSSARLWRDTALAAVLTLPVFVVEMGGHFIPGFHMALHGLIAPQQLWLAEFVLVTLVLLRSGAAVFQQGPACAAAGRPGYEQPCGGWQRGGLGLFQRGDVRACADPGGVSRSVYFEAAAVIVTLILLGRSLEARARGRAGAAIARLVKLAPKTARKLVEGVVQEVEVASLLPGDRVQIRPGERIPADGLVVSGQSTWTSRC